MLSFFYQNKFIINLFQIIAFLIQNIKETQEDLFFLEKEWRELEEKSMDIEGSKSNEI